VVVVVGGPSSKLRHEKQKGRTVGGLHSAATITRHWKKDLRAMADGRSAPSGVVVALGAFFVC
jgi:hypothetical protein